MSKMVYVPQGGGVSKEAAQFLGEQFEAIADQEPLKPETVVERARPEMAPLHPYFEWDDETAAEQYRLVQARYYLRHIAVIREEDGEPIRAFHVVDVQRATFQSTMGGKDGEDDLPPDEEFKPLREVMAEPYLMRQVVDKALRELKGWQQRYAQYSELQGVAMKVKDAIERIEQERVAEAA